MDGHEVDAMIHSRILYRTLLSPTVVLGAFLLLAAGGVLAADGDAKDKAPRSGDPAACPMMSSGYCPMHDAMHGHGYGKGKGWRATAGPARAALGISIAADGESGAVDGVTVEAVAPGSGAADAGLKAGDLLTAVNGDSLAAGSRSEANSRLVRFMASVDPGEEVTVSYRRDGRDHSARVEARPLPRPSHAWQSWPGRPLRPDAFRADVFRGLRLATLSPDLGRYFGASEGLLVLRVPATAGLPLRDGDVIEELDGRKPRNPGHARSILASYAPGETITFRILRDRKGQTLKYTVPSPPDPASGPGAGDGHGHSPQAVPRD
jgi:S1-C subfamily serine protease